MHTTTHRWTCKIGRLAIWGVLNVLVCAPAFARGRIMLGAGEGYVIEWQSAGVRRVIARPRVEKNGLFPLDRWLQVAPGGGAAAAWSAATGLAVIASDGASLFHHKGAVTSFRFSSDGTKLAFATARGIEILTLGESQPTAMCSLGNVEEIRWTSVGLIARLRSSLVLVSDKGRPRTLASIRPGTAFAASKDRVVYFSRTALVSLSLATNTSNSTALPVREPVLDAELSPDGVTLLFATATQIFQQVSSERITTVAKVGDVSILSFSPDGTAYLWATPRTGGVVAGTAQPAPMPAGTLFARFDQTSGRAAVITNGEGIFRWNTSDGSLSLAGGISPADGVNFAGDVVGPGAAVVFYFKKPGWLKKMEPPTIRLQ